VNTFWENFAWHMFALWAFGLSGILLLYIGYWVFDKLTPGIHFTRELVENKNVAAAIMIAAILIGVALIVAATLLG
jgi:putative membrane protein